MIKKNEIRIRAANKRRMWSDSEIDDEADSSNSDSQHKFLPINSSTMNNFAKKLLTIHKDRLNNQLLT